ncbi:MAG: lytic transglycosylase [Myxococcales bacterium]|nr:lytic transglycosylase [Myxococcales bacterium]
MSKSQKILLLSLLLGILLPTTRFAKADLYQYKDSEGNTHFSNNPRDERFKMVPIGPQGPGFSTIQNKRYDALIASAAAHYSLPAALIKAVIARESAFNPKAVSKAGAQGLMQIIPATAKEVGLKDPFDPVQNIFAGSRYLRILLNRFDGNLMASLAAYNAGPHQIKDAYGIPPFPETLNYVKRVLSLYLHYLKQEQSE